MVQNMADNVLPSPVMPPPSVVVAPGDVKASQVLVPDTALPGARTQLFGPPKTQSVLSTAKKLPSSLPTMSCSPPPMGAWAPARGKVLEKSGPRLSASAPIFNANTFGNFSESKNGPIQMTILPSYGLSSAPDPPLVSGGWESP